jgi:hypothetical protein
VIYEWLTTSSKRDVPVDQKKGSESPRSFVKKNGGSYFINRIYKWSTWLWRGKLHGIQETVPSAKKRYVE